MEKLLLWHFRINGVIVPNTVVIMHLIIRAQTKMKHDIFH